MKKAVLDTNVLVSGIFWRGKPNHLLERMLALDVEISASPKMLAEYVDVIDKMAGKRDARQLAERWSERLFGRLRMVDVPAKFKACRDPKDNMFVDCALASGTVIIVSGDDDLLSLQGIVKGVKFLTVEQAIALLK